MRRRTMRLLLVLFSCLGMQLHATNYNIPTGNVAGVVLHNQPSGNSVTFNGDTGVMGDWTISNTEGCGHDFPIYMTQDVFLHAGYSVNPAFNRSSITFYAGANSRIIFNVDYDLIFTGSNSDWNSALNRELTITFSGPGQTKFIIASGKQVGFEGFFENAGQTNWNKYYDDYSLTGSGVMAYITMDQTHDQAVRNGQNKVVFERYYTVGLDPVKTDTQKSVKVSIGKNSFITFISDIDTGLLASGIDAKGYGSIAFDPSCYGLGRMLLHLKGSSYVADDGEVNGLPGAYNDAALVVSGHYVADYSTPSGIKNTVNLNKPAGVEAICRIIDDAAWTDTHGYYQAGGTINTDPDGQPVLVGGSWAGDPSRRGLLVLNQNTSVPNFAADPYRNNNWSNGYVFNTLHKGTTSIQPGFILGANGKMELFHNTFLDYVAASTAHINSTEKDYFGSLLITSSMKKHNPSALIIDGLNKIDISNFDPANPYDPARLLFPYVADNAANGGRHAQILLRGDSRLYLRSGVMSNGVIDKAIAPGHGLGGYFTMGGDHVYSFTINSALEGRYDGSTLVGTTVGSSPLYETPGEGNHVMDVEGKLTIYSGYDTNETNPLGFLTCKLNRDISSLDGTPSGTTCADPIYGTPINRHALTSAAARGLLNVPAVKIDQMGREIFNDVPGGGGCVIRPLIMDSYYPCYNSSSILTNADMALHNVQWHHSDVLKIATPEQDRSEPSVVGGEVASLYNTYFTRFSTTYTDTLNTLFVKNPIEGIRLSVPEIRLFDTTFHAHESFVSSGVRFVVTDKFIYSPLDPIGYADLKGNTSLFICYNHGDSLDMLKRGYGRTLMFGTQQNKMADGIVMDDYTQNAYVNIFRGWNTNANATTWGTLDKLIRLELQSDAQPKYVGQYKIRSSGDYSLLVNDGVSQYKRCATEVFYLGNGSFMSLGWTTTTAEQRLTLADMAARVHATDGSYSYSFGINGGFKPVPWDPLWGSAVPVKVDGSVASYSDFMFSLSSEANNRAELYINGDNYYFGGRSATGNLPTEPVVATNESCIVYTNHGGRLHINQDTLCVDSLQYVETFVDTIFAYKAWPRIWSANQSAYIDGLSGIVDLPHDQVKFGRSIQPYGLDFPNMLMAGDGQTKENMVRLSVYDDQTYGNNPTKRSRASGSEVSIAWNFRTDKSVSVRNPYEPSPTFTPIKQFPVAIKNLPMLDMRSTKTGQEILNEAGSLMMTECLLTVSSGDIIEQMRVSGATAADPFHLYITGCHKGYGIVREITSLESNYFSPGWGDYGAIYMDGGAHLGLGHRDWNEYSSSAWTLLGYDHLTLCPNGNCVVELNSDVIVSDRLPILPTRNFGSANNVDQVLTFSRNDQRLTFYSSIPKQIIVPEGGEFDLSALGFPAGTITTTYPQQIEFAGKVRLVMEAGSRIRFPNNPTVEPVLYFNDESELIFKGSNHPDEEIWSDYRGSDDVRTKILGCGQIWLNKQAKMRIYDTSLVGVETDDYTITTSLTISLQRQAMVQLGDENTIGGGLQVGNPVSRSGFIYFNLKLNGLETMFNMQRESFFGTGVGTINKFDQPDGNWKLLGLYDVKKVSLGVLQGFFNHNQIFSTRDERSALMAIGPCNTYTVTLGDKYSAYIRGGGNLLYVAAPGDIYTSATFVGNTANVTGGTTGNGTIIASTASIRQLNAVANGTGTVVRNTSFSGDLQGLYNYLGFPPFGKVPSVKAAYACLATTEQDEYTGYVAGDANNTIKREVGYEPGDHSNVEDSVNVGAYGATVDANGFVSMFTHGF